MVENFFPQRSLPSWRLESICGGWVYDEFRRRYFRRQLSNFALWKIADASRELCSAARGIEPGECAPGRICRRGPERPRKFVTFFAVSWRTSGRIYVGTGDVARFSFVSEDGGEQWRQIWDEGFTSAVTTPDGAQILFGPDTLKAHSLVSFDPNTKKLKEVWKPLKHGYAGYTYSMLRVDGVDYVGMHTEANEVASFHPKYGVIASRDGRTWYPLVEYGPVTNEHASSVYLTAGKNLIYASIDGFLHTFQPLSKSWFENHSPFKS